MSSDHHKVIRTLAWLIRNEGVDPQAIERAVDSARRMKPGEQASLTGLGINREHEVMRRAFLAEQVGLLLKD